MTTAFLTATWSNLFLASYAVPRALLEPRLPPGTVLDLRDGQAFVSLVAFEFLDTRVGGIAWPGYRDFAELNLRFYVRCGNDRGVVFVREFVPQRLVAWLARALYNEPYVAAPFLATRDDGAGVHAMRYQLTWAGREHDISVIADASPVSTSDDSVESFFKEHRWGFGRTRGGRPLRYEVDHPKWEVYPVRSHRIDLDWAAVYGAEWSFLADAQPCSTVLAVGSPVRVLRKRGVSGDAQACDSGAGETDSAT
jgi:uncharacterized protein YqjF (DUF2071 family)